MRVSFFDDDEKVAQGLSILKKWSDPYEAICFDLEFVSLALPNPPELCLIQVAKASLHGEVFLFDAITASNVLTVGPQGGSLGELLSNSITKVFHDVRRDCKALQGRHVSFGSNSVFDTQVAHEILRGRKMSGLDYVLKDWLGVELEMKEMGKKMHMRQPKIWRKRPLSSKLLNYAAEDVTHLPALYERMLAEAKRKGLLAQIMSKSWERVVRNVGGEPRSVGVSSSADPAIIFGRALLNNEPMRMRCEDRIRFNEEYLKFCELNGINNPRSHSSVLWKLSKMSIGERLKEGVVELRVRGGQFIIFGKGSGSSRKLAEAKLRVMDNRDSIIADKGGVEVSALEFDEVLRKGDRCFRELTITNNCNIPRKLLSAKLLRRGGTGFSFGDSNNRQVAVQGLPLELGPSQSLTITVSWTARIHGMSYETISLAFNGFSIGRFIEGRCGDVDLLDDLKPVGEYSPKKFRDRRREGSGSKWVKEDVPAPSPSGGDGGGKFMVPLEDYHVPPAWRDQLRVPEACAEELGAGVEAIGGGSQVKAMKAYANHFDKLLWTEEEQLVVDLMEFNLCGDKSQTMERVGPYLRVHIKGLAEKRPSVLKGDTLRVNIRGQTKTFKGRAEKIEMEDVLLSFHQSFHNSYVAGTPVEIRFILGRTPQRLFHQGCLQAKKLRPALLFPTPMDTNEGKLYPARVNFSARFRNHLITNNPPQASAVRNVVEARAKNVPYVIFGPPGTGKTTTVVECIVQCAALGVKILVAAPTNTAADLLCTLLVNTGVLDDSRKLHRLNAYSRSRLDVPKEVLRHSTWNGENFENLPLEELLVKQVVVATLSTASKLRNNGVKNGHFDMVIIDEAGQAMEPEAVAPVACLLSGQGQLLLAGDPQQLGPVIHSAVAKENGLADSFLERLMRRRIYSRGRNGRFDERVLTQLTHNFRSHEALLELPNRLFYDNALECKASAMLKNHCVGWDQLPNRKIPMIFHGIVGKDMRERGSPSWFNPDECAVCVDYVKQLLDIRGKTVLPSEIGVIAPYHKQVMKLTRAFKGQDFDVSANGIKVGSTEHFQGQERKIIIISTVRSSEEHVGTDVRHNIGFLDNPKRFNVSITRACSLLIVIGNPNVLWQDEHWQALIRRCLDLKAYTGMEFTPPADGENNNGNDEMTFDDLEELNQGEVSAAVLQEGMAMPTYQ